MLFLLFPVDQIDMKLHTASDQVSLTIDFFNFLLWEIHDLMPCEVSCQLDQLEKAENTIYAIKKIPVRAAKSRPGQNDPYGSICCSECHFFDQVYGVPYFFQFIRLT